MSANTWWLVGAKPADSCLRMSSFLHMQCQFSRSSVCRHPHHSIQRRTWVVGSVALQGSERSCRLGLCSPKQCNVLARHTAQHGCAHSPGAILLAMDGVLEKLAGCKHGSISEFCWQAG